jgi:hypothetical protein
MTYWCDVEAPAEMGGNLRRWDCQKISWRDMGVRYPTADFSVAMKYTIRKVEDTCGLGIEIRDTPANVESYFVRIDGRNGVLARMYLPGTPSRCHEQVRGQWDTAEQPSQDALNLVTLHEFLHALGLGHHDSAPSIMNSRLNMEMVNKVDDWTRDQLRLRYGPPEDADEPGPAPPPGEEFDLKAYLVKMHQHGLEILGE